MGATSCKLSHLMRNRPDVGAGGDSRHEMRTTSFHAGNLELLDFHLHRLERRFLLFAGEFVSRHAVYFLGGEWRRGLFDDSLKHPCQLAYLSHRDPRLLHGTDGFAFSVVSVSRKSEANYTFVALFRRHVELSQPSQISEHQWQHAGRQRIECTQVPDRSLLQNAAHTIDDIVRGEAGRLIDYEDAIHEN